MPPMKKIAALALFSTLALAQASESIEPRSGQLDQSFGRGGVLELTGFKDSAQSLSASVPQALELGADGKLVLVTAAAAGKTRVLRFLPTGAPDEEFGDEGKVEVSTGCTACAQKLITQADGTILLGGYDSFSRSDLELRHMAFVRLKKDGSLDKEYGKDGVHLIANQPTPMLDWRPSVHALGVSRWLGTIALGIDHLIFPDSSTPPVKLRQLFSIHGPLAFETAQSLADGSIVLGGFDGPRSAPTGFVAMLNTTLQPQAAFGAGKGYVRLPSPSSVTSIVQDTEAGALFVAGSLGVSKGFFVARLKSDGSLDQAFGQAGMVAFNDQPVDGKVYLARFSQGPNAGKLLIAGSSDGLFSRTILARLNADGKPDHAFGESGIARLGDKADDAMAKGHPGVTIDLGSSRKAQVSGLTIDSLGRALLQMTFGAGQSMSEERIGLVAITQ